jgi:hypothetical protein
MIKKFLFFLTLTCLLLTSNLAAQVLKFKSAQSVLYENNIATGKIYGTSYFTFDYNNKCITIKTIESKGTHVFVYKMKSTVLEKGTIMGDCHKIYVSSIDKPEILSISFNQGMSVIWLDSKNSTIFYVDLSKVEL